MYTHTHTHIYIYYSYSEVNTLKQWYIRGMTYKISFSIHNHITNISIVMFDII